MYKFSMPRMEMSMQGKALPKLRTNLTLDSTLHVPTPYQEDPGYYKQAGETWIILYYMAKDISVSSR